jgi:hypothetical protein
MNYKLDYFTYHQFLGSQQAPQQPQQQHTATQVARHNAMQLAQQT